MRDKRSSEGSAPPSRPDKGESRAELRARQAAEERERREWIARRKREDQEAAEAEERERQEWIARRKREDREAAEAAAREKAAKLAERKRLEEERRREEERAEENAKRREKEAKEAERRRRAQKRAEKGKKILRAVKIALLVVMLLVILTGVGWLLISRKIDGGANLPNVFLDGIPVGGLTKEETEQKLEEEGWGDPALRYLRVELPMDVSFELDRQEAGLMMSREQAAEAAYSYGRSSDQMDNVGTYLGSGFSTVDLAGERGRLNQEYVRQQAAAAVAEFRQKTSGESFFLDTEKKVLHFVKGAGQMDIDLDKLCAALEDALLSEETLLVYDEIEGNLAAPNFRELYKQLRVEPVDAHFADKNFEVIPGTPGLDFDIPTARRMWLEAEPMEEILIPMREVEPRITAEKLEGELFKDCLGSQTSSYGGSSNARVNNINLAVSYIDGVILMPGETFSYNQTVGQRTLARGFQEAPAYASGEVVMEVGGGICQVSSTLYCASLYARMTIVDRTYHHFRVTYLPPGQDATVSWESPDYKFRNDRDYPVKIVAWCDNDTRQLTIQIWGTDTDGIWVTLSCEQYAVHDDEFPEVVIGSNVYLFINYYDADGNYLETKQGYASTYMRHDYEIDWPPEKFKDKDDEGGEGGGSGEGEIIIDDGGGGGGGSGDEGGGGGDSGGGEGGGDSGGGDGEIVVEP